MVWQTIVCILAACGLAMVFWVLFGAWLLPLRPKRGGLMILWRAAGDERSFRRTYEAMTWLRESGLIPETLLIWDDGLDEAAGRAAGLLVRSDPRIRIADDGLAEQLRESMDGRDDSAGHCECGGVSE